MSSEQRVLLLALKMNKQIQLLVRNLIKDSHFSIVYKLSEASDCTHKFRSILKTPASSFFFGGNKRQSTGSPVVAPMPTNFDWNQLRKTKKNSFLNLN